MISRNHSTGSGHGGAWLAGICLRDRLGRLGGAGLAVALLLGVACGPPPGEREPRLTLVVGVDVSGSFARTGHYDDALRFTAHYLYGHLNELGGLEPPRALFVGSIGGEQPGQPQSFHPIHDFRGKSVDEIESDLRSWFTPEDQLTDFNAFFDRVATLVKRQNLILAPLTIVEISDGVPDLSPRMAGGQDNRYQSIDLEPLEFLSRNVTIRLLYATPPVAVKWEQEIPRRRVRIWTVDGQVMEGWREQVAPNVAIERQEALWKWIAENVDFRVRRRLL
jgi:hypothetical protein